MEYTLCNYEFCIFHGDWSDIVNCMEIKKYLDTVQSNTFNNSMSNFLNEKTQNVMEKLSLAAQETISANHTVVHHHSFKSKDCTIVITKNFSMIN